MFLSPSFKKSAKEFKEFHKFAQVHYLPKIKAMKTLGTYDANGQPKAVPNYFIGLVVNG